MTAATEARAFDRGFGGVVSVRQYIARNRAVGLTAEQQSFDRIDSDDAPSARPTPAATSCSSSS
jgi:hypothetical protein